MSAALFDSNIVIDFAAGLPEAFNETRRYEKLFISIVTWIEVMAGAGSDDDLALREILAGFDLLQLNPDISEVAARIRRDRRIKLPDAIIQATAEVSGLLLITRNTRDFPSGMSGVRNPYKL